MTPRGFQPLTVSTTAVGLTVPAAVAEANFAFVRCETTNVRWRDDGTAPTAAVGGGTLMEVGEALEYDGNLRAIKFIRDGAADATLDITYYRA
jgi:hypothetical protein